MGMRGRNLDIFEKFLAGMIDVASVLVAYNIGMARLGLAYGVIYAGMDAFVVVWLSRPITGIVRRLNPARRARREYGEAADRCLSDTPKTTAATNLPGEERRTGANGAGLLDPTASAAAARC